MVEGKSTREGDREHHHEGVPGQYWAGCSSTGWKEVVQESGKHHYKGEKGIAVLGGSVTESLCRYKSFGCQQNRLGTAAQLKAVELRKRQH